MVILLTIVHVLVCFFLIIVVLLQSGKAADLAGAFGGMGSQTAFGPRGAATVLSKATTVAAVLFMLTSLSLSVVATRRSGSESTVLETTQPRPNTRPTDPSAGQPSITITPEGSTKEVTLPLTLPPKPEGKGGDQKSGAKK
jgi:preprotein translocase subunit SecG